MYLRTNTGIQWNSAKNARGKRGSPEGQFGPLFPLRCSNALQASGYTTNSSGSRQPAGPTRTVWSESAILRAVWQSKDKGSAWDEKTWELLTIDNSILQSQLMCYSCFGAVSRFPFPRSDEGLCGIRQDLSGCSPPASSPHYARNHAATFRYSSYSIKQHDCGAHIASKWQCCPYPNTCAVRINAGTYAERQITGQHICQKNLEWPAPVTAQRPKQMSTREIMGEHHENTHTHRRRIVDIYRNKCKSNAHRSAWHLQPQQLSGVRVKRRCVKNHSRNMENKLETCHSGCQYSVNIGLMAMSAGSILILEYTSSCPCVRFLHLGTNPRTARRIMSVRQYACVRTNAKMENWKTAAGCKSQYQIYPALRLSKSNIVGFQGSFCLSVLSVTLYVLILLDINMLGWGFEAKYMVPCWLKYVWRPAGKISPSTAPTPSMYPTITPSAWHSFRGKGIVTVLR